jgi:PKD repeat protein
MLYGSLVLGAAVVEAAVIPPTNWTITFVDSQETSAENGDARNAIDGNATTIWHTEWSSSLPDPAPPHEIRIDLGAVYTISGFRYLPRQGGSLNGTVALYEFYVSADGVSWPAPVATGTFAKSAAEKEVLFAPVTGRYVRFRALSEVNGKPWTSVAELSVLDTAPTNQPPDGRIDSPAADIVINPGGVVAFTGTGTDPEGATPLTFRWQFGAGSGIADSTLEDPGNVVFAKSGTYAVTFTVTDPQGNADPVPATRTVSVRTFSPLIPKSAWRLLFVDSQEMTGEPAPAVNSFDGNPSTYWHTEWSPAIDPPPPHEIQIDLGGTYDVDGFRYLPRQDGSFNGAIGQYEFYVSADGVGWGEPAAIGTFQKSSVMKEVYFAPRRGRYVRLRALREASGRAWTSVAELDVTGVSAPTNEPPDGLISLPASDVTIRKGESVQFVGSASDPDGNLPLTQRWQFGAGSGVFDVLDVSPGPVQFNVPGTYTVTLSVIDSLGGVDPTPATRTVTVLADPFGLVPSWLSVKAAPFDLRVPAGVTNPVLTAAAAWDAQPATNVADPFMFHEGNTWYMFFEVWNLPGGRGRIGLATSPDGLHWTYDRLVLDEPNFHVSQPMVFKWNGVYYMLPETNQINEIRLYTADAFPYQWRYLTTLVSGKRFVDASVFRYNDMWWMFASDTGNTKTYLYYSTDLTSGWLPHPNSPIVNDPSKARPAGRSFVFDGNRVIRVAQKTDVTYGEQLRAFQVDVLTTTDYAEHEIPESPIFKASGTGWNAKSAHHFDPWWTGDRWLVSTDGRDANDRWSIGIYESIDASAPNGVITAPTSDVTLIAGQSVDFQGAGNDPDDNVPLSYLWRFGTGSGIADAPVQNPGLVRFNTPGDYDVSLTVTDAAGHIDPSPAVRRVKVLSNAAAIPKTGWTLKAVDSEETTNENGQAENAFDDNVATYWHTQWTGGSPPHPHEIQIDLGARFSMNGFRYLPRQDGGVNGRVKDYELYVSEDGVAWGTPVATGTFVTDSAMKEVGFSSTVGRYIRFRALSEVNGGPWTSVAEIGVLGAPAPPVVPTAGLGLWLKADAGVTLAGNAVAQWADQSGNNRLATQSTASRQPLLVNNALNGKPALSFNGTGQYLRFDLPVNGLSGMTMILVAANSANRTGGESNAENAALFWNETGEWGTVYLSPFQSNVKFRFGTGQTDNLPAYQRPASIGNAYSISVATKQGTTDTLHVNGQLVVTQGGKRSQIALTQSAGNVGRGYNNSTYFPGQIAEVLVYTRALTDAERQGVEAYLKAKYFPTAP